MNKKEFFKPITASKKAVALLGNEVLKAEKLVQKFTELNDDGILKVEAKEDKRFNAMLGHWLDVNEERSRAFEPLSSATTKHLLEYVDFIFEPTKVISEKDEIFPQIEVAKSNAIQYYKSLADSTKVLQEHILACNEYADQKRSGRK